MSHQDSIDNALPEESLTPGTAEYRMAEKRAALEAYHSWVRYYAATVKILIDSWYSPHASMKAHREWVHHHTETCSMPIDRITMRDIFWMAGKTRDDFLADVEAARIEPQQETSQ